MLAAGILGALIFHFRRGITLAGFRWPLVWQTAREARLSLLALSVVTIYVAYAIRALRWQRFARGMGPARFIPLYLATLMGFACVFLLGRAGEPVRPLLIARKDGQPVSGSFGVYVIERLMDISATVVLAGIALLAFRTRQQTGAEAATLLRAARSTGIALFIGLMVLIAFLVWFRRSGSARVAPRLERMKSRGGWRARFALMLAGFGEGLQSIQTVADLLWAILYTALHWILIVFTYLWITHSFGGSFLEFDFIGAMMLLAFTMVGSALQIPGVGGGSQVAAFLAFTAVFGIEKEPAATASIILWLVTFASSCILGVPLLIREGWSMGELRNLARSERAAEAAGGHTPLYPGEGKSKEARP